MGPMATRVAPGRTIYLIVVLLTVCGIGAVMREARVPLWICILSLVATAVVGLVWMRWEIRAERQVVPTAPELEYLVHCEKCGEAVPEWFVEYFPDGGIFAGQPGVDTELTMCRHCSESWPYPPSGQSEDDYVEALRESIRLNRAALVSETPPDEQQKRSST